MVYWKVVEHRLLAEGDQLISKEHYFRCKYKAQQFYDERGKHYTADESHYIDKPERVEDTLLTPEEEIALKDFSVHYFE